MYVYGVYVEDQHNGDYFLDTLYEDYDEAVRACLDYANSQMKRGDFIQRFGDNGELVIVVREDGFSRITCKPYSWFLKLR